MTRPDYCYLAGRLVERPGHKHPDPEHWQKLRADVFARQGDACATCPEAAAELHHRHYDTYGNEQPEDVIGLCIACHTAITSRLRGGRYTAGQLSPAEIAGKTKTANGETGPSFRPPSKTVAIPVTAQPAPAERFKPKVREPFTLLKGTDDV